jgi:glucose-1-phosphate thymidylyltransferase
MTSVTSSTRIVGLLPAAGMGTRLHPFHYAKELLPVAFFRAEDGSSVRPIVSAEYSIRAMRDSGIERCYVIVSDWKTELIRYFGDGSDFGLPISYLHRRIPRGLSDALDSAYGWISDSLTCLSLPDSIFSPKDSIKAICTEIVRSNADVVLGVFPTAEPQHLGPVQLKEDGTIVRVFDKPADQHFKNTWGIAVWNIRFTEFLHGKVQSHSPEDESPSLGGIFDEAIREGLSVRAVYFEKGSYYDIGRAESLGSLMIQAT